MGKRVAVEADTCISCGLCPAEAPDVFDIREEAFAEVILDSTETTEDGMKFYELSDDMLADVENAAEGCPTESIKIRD